MVRFCQQAGSRYGKIKSPARLTMTMRKNLKTDMNQHKLFSLIELPADAEPNKETKECVNHNLKVDEENIISTPKYKEHHQESNIPGLKNYRTNIIPSSGYVKHEVIEIGDSSLSLFDSINQKIWYRSI